MKKLLIASAVALSLSSLGASAAVITAGGIQWDDTILGPGSVSAQVNFQQWFTNSPTTTDLGTDGIVSADDYERITTNAAVGGAVGTELVGLGEFYSFSDGRTPNDPPSFCVTPNCELTFAFGGLEVLTLGIAGGLNATFDTSNAWLNIYYDAGTDFDGPGVSDTTLSSTAHTKFAEAQNGTLWAAFDIDSFFLDGTIIGGEAESLLNIRNVAGLGLDEVKDAWDYNGILGSDLAATLNAIFNPGALYSQTGNGLAETVVPAPSTIALFGLGLLGVAVGVRRRKSK
ncbi:MAG: hypothetical protein ACI8R9_001582 [Paraglaciecola sp.]|jgi:uncharacterized protein YaiE (UPF0345 family)